MKIAYFDCFSGISGDMTIAALLDAGLPMRVLSDGLKKLGIKGYELRRERVRRQAISGTRFECIDHHAGAHGHRSLREITALVRKSALNKRVISIAESIFGRIAAAEAAVHGVRNKDSVYLHELGELDSIVDIVGAAIAIDALGIDEVYSSPVTMGRTFVKTMHGTIPIPGPAALELMKGVPVEICEVRAELVTPTGAGILNALVKEYGPMPRIEISAIGYGAGSRDIEEFPNMLRVVIGERSVPKRGESVVVIEANIDDMNPQYFEHLFRRLFDEEALDVYITPIQMKKMRPAFKLSVICERDKLESLSSIIFAETTTIGVRFNEANRFTLDRRMVVARTGYGRVKVKVSGLPGSPSTVSPEYEDCASIARKKRVPLRSVYDAARSAVQMTKRSKV